MTRGILALLTGEGVESCSAGEIWYFFEQALDYPVTLINALIFIFFSGVFGKMGN